MNTENHPSDIRTFYKGAHPNIAKELLGASNTGQYSDAINLRSTSITGDDLSLNKIKGEEVVYPDVTTSGIYQCIGMIVVHKKVVEVMVDAFGVEDPIIRINGVIYAKSPRIPFKYDFPLQIDKNESCDGGEIFITDDNVPPMILNIGDMIDSYGTQKYFSDFNPDLYYVNLVAPLDIPVFDSLTNVGGGAGLPVGTYQYAIRYVTEAGDRTNRGPLTPPIPVVQTLADASYTYPSSKTGGSNSNTEFPTSYGIKLKFRVTNISNYNYIELIRISNNTEGGPNYTPVTEVIAKIDIAPQEISIREFIDPIASNTIEVVTNTEDAGQLAYIERAKAIRYYDTRLWLMNITFPKRELELEFTQTDGQESFPVVKNLGINGHSDPFNHTYYKGYMSNERYSFGIQGYDAAAGKSFVQEVPSLLNYTFPSRRTPVSATSSLYSYDGVPVAANVNGVVSEVFEAIDHSNAVGKNDGCSFRNILKKGNKPLATVNNWCNTDPEDYGAKVTILNDVKPPYAPYGPVGNNDRNDNTGYLANVEVNDGSSWLRYSPVCYRHNYYSKGIAISGVRNFPAWMKSFSVVRKKAAGRVIAQGIGMYAMNSGDFDFIGNKALATKRLDRLWFYSPDFASGIASGDQLSDIISNPGNYRIEFVSPLGFYSEVYNFEGDTLPQRRSRIVDMISYARVLFDTGQINPGESGVGVGGYVAFNKYRNSHAVNGGIFSINGTTGAYNLNSVKTQTEGRNTYVELQLDTQVYQTYGVGGTSGSEFNDPELRDWTEPFYIINIIAEGKQIIDENINEYLSTGHYQKLESIIGLGDGTANQSFELVDERWEDCISDRSSSGPFASRDAFVYIKDKAGNSYAWIDVSYKSAVDYTTIVNDIAVNGFHTTSGGVNVYGVYNHSVSSDNRKFTIEFNLPGFNVPDQHYVVVKYDDTMPIIVFGGDTTVGETLFSPIDRKANGKDDQDQKDEQFIMNLGFPFRQYRMNPRHYIVRDTTGVNKIQNDEQANLGYIRQLVVMFCCESRIATHYAFNLADSTQYYPKTHYIMRPNRFDDSSFGSGMSDVANDNNIFVDYFNDYPNEHLLWTYGGFRFIQSFNVDYSKESPIDHTSKPKVGFEEKTHFCTAVAPSLPRAVNSQDAPGLKTFLAATVYYLNDDTGPIKFAYDAKFEGKGDNIYAVTNKGVCLILTKKSILSNINADEISVMQTDAVIQGEYWLSRTIGCNDEMWRSRADASIPIQSQAGEEKVDACFWGNQESVFMLSMNRVVDIQNDYSSKLKPALSRVLPGYYSLVAGHYDSAYDEYWIQIEAESIDDCCDKENILFAFSAKKSHWNGRYTYRFERYASDGDVSYGSRDGGTFVLDRGYIINGSPIQCMVEAPFSAQQKDEKEFIRFRAKTLRGSKPDEIQFIDENGSVMCRLDLASKGPLFLKNYGGWEQGIPRKDYNYDFKRSRVQGRLLLYRIIHNLASEFGVIDVEVQFKILK
jgi:hypothetical protein